MEHVKKVGAIVETLNDDGKLNNGQYCEMSERLKKMFDKKQSEWVVKILYVDIQTTIVYKDDEGDTNMLTERGGFEFETQSCSNEDCDCCSGIKLTFCKVQSEFKQKELILRVVDFAPNPYIDIKRGIISDRAVRHSKTEHIISIGSRAFFKVLDFDLLNNQGEPEPEPEPES
tara:strand:+ start:5354 stop:5872 length:519 start_codon:yes stop_codon:yes gene_type:complete